MAPAAARGNVAATKGTPRVGMAMACRSSAFGLGLRILKLVGCFMTVDKIDKRYGYTLTV